MSVRKMVLVAMMLCLSAAAASAQTLRVNADRTTLRDKPSTDGAAVTSLVKGDELTVIERIGTWYRVRVRNTGTEGFVNALLVDVVGAAAPAVAAPAAPAPATPAPPLASPAPATPPTQTSSATPATPGTDRNYMIRIHAGLLTGYGNAGLGLGGGVGLRPFDNEKMEVTIDALYGRTSQGYLGNNYSTSVLGVSGNFVYNFQPPSQSFTPFAGAGLVMSRASVSSDSLLGYDFSVSGTYTAIQLLGGIEKPLNDKRAFRAELRSGFASFGGSLLLLAGLSF